MMIEPQSEAVLIGYIWGRQLLDFPVSLLLVIFFTVIFIITVIFNIIVIIIAVTFDFFIKESLSKGYLRIALGYEITATSESSEEKGFVQHKTAFNF